MLIKIRKDYFLLIFHEEAAIWQRIGDPMKKISLMQTEFVILAYLSQSAELMKIAGSGLKGKELSKIFKNKNNLDVLDELVKRDLILHNTGEDVIGKAFFSYDKLYIKNNEENLLKEAAIQLKNLVEQKGCIIEVLVMQGRYSDCADTLFINQKGELSVKFNEKTRLFQLEIADKEERNSFFSERLHIPASYTVPSGESFQIPMDTKHFLEMLQKQEVPLEAIANGLEAGVGKELLDVITEKKFHSHYIKKRTLEAELFVLNTIYHKNEYFYLVQSYSSPEQIVISKVGFNEIVERITEIEANTANE